MPRSDDDKLSRKLAEWKRQLIDLTRRNRLLNYKPTKASTVQIVDEIPQQVIRQLVDGGRFVFDPTPETETNDLLAEDGQARAPESRALDTGKDLELGQGNFATIHTDDRLQTPHLKPRLENNLLNIFRRSQSILEEQGINALFLALGMLEWYASDDSEELNIAPLLMVPVVLKRRTPSSPFRLRVAGDDPFINLAIAEKLRLDFGVQLPVLPDLSEDIDVDEIFKEVRKSVRRFDRWRLTSDIALSLFNFQKFVMYRDLERNESRSKEHQFLRALAGVERHPAGGTLPAEVREADLDEAMSPWTSTQVLDADSSQQRAILAVKKNSDLVIEGPPGTGKSQTIANLIADSLRDGKSVLFVSEKMAALDVVKTRLESVGLGEFCLELHSNRTRKTAFVQDLARSLDGARLGTADGRDLSKLRGLTSRLKEYVMELHQPFGALAASPYEAIGELVEVEGAPEVNVSLEDLPGISRRDYVETCDRLTVLSLAIEQVGEPTKHPLRGVGLTRARPSERTEIHDAVDSSLNACKTLAVESRAFASWLGLREPTTIGDVDKVLKAADVMARSPGVELSILRNDSWNEVPEAARQLLLLGREFASLKKRLKHTFKPNVLLEDLEPEIAELRSHLETRLRFLKPAFWRCRRLLREFRPTGYARHSDQQLLSDHQLAARARKLKERIEGTDELGIELFGERWKGIHSDWSQLVDCADWLVELRQIAMAQILEDKGFELASRGQFDRDDLEKRVHGLQNANAAAVRSVQALQTKLDLDIDASGINADLSTDLSQLIQRIEELQAGLPTLPTWIRYWRSRTDCSQGVEASFVAAAIDSGVSPEFLVNAFRRRFLTLWLEECFEERLILDEFSALEHETQLADFRHLDRESFELARQDVSSALAKKRQNLLAPELKTQLQTISWEARKKRRIKPIRKLLQECAQAVQIIKPCFMMGPLSVAQYVEPDFLSFDLLVFDEASQIPPPDAIGSILRANQVVIVGDSKQLPPTNFFTAQLDAADDDSDELGFDDLESVLDQAAAAGTPRSRLKWHYRSRHESLIRFSNEEFYAEDPLYVFPSVAISRPDLGLQFEFVDGGTYEGKGVNSVEARRVADAVVRHIETRRDLTLGVGTFGMAQQNRILDELDIRRRQNPSIEWFFNREGEEKFFVKNLENIQGDDRDVIFISVTYGPGRDGVIRRNFGPINTDGGWRRLNVITTRAKQLMVVFASMRGRQINISDGRTGPTLLHNYLTYAESGNYPMTKIRVDVPEPNAFELAVMQGLVERGYKVVPQVGDAGYRIDIGVLDPEAPGQFLCGVECDGASYHSALTVRERDRLRQQVLEDRDWVIHRVWSTDWFHDRDGQIERLVKKIEDDKKRSKQTALPHGEKIEDDSGQEPENADPGDSPDPSDDPLPAKTSPDIQEYTIAHPRKRGSREKFYTAPQKMLMDVVREVVKIEGPIHVDLLATRVASAWGLTKAKSTIKRKIRAICSQLVRRRKLTENDDFFWASRTTTFQVRSRANYPGSFPAKLISIEEIAEAVCMVLRQGDALPDELPYRTARLLGFKKAGSKLGPRINGAVEHMRLAGELEPSGTGIRLFGN